MGAVPSLMSNMCVYVCSEQSEEAGVGHENGTQSAGSFRQVSWFIVPANRDTGPTA